MPARTTADVEAILKAHARSSSLEELAAEGKRQVRVVSTRDILPLIQSVVDRAIAKGAGSLAQAERERLAARAKGEVERVLRFKADAEEKLRRQQDTIQQYQTLVESLQAREADLCRQLDETRAQHEKLSEIRVLLSRLSEQQAAGTGDLSRRLEQSLDRAVGEIGRTVQHEVQAVQLGPGRSTARESAGVVDQLVDATGPLLSRIFEDDPDLESNSSQLDLDESESSEGIAGNLERLRALRGGGKLPRSQAKPGDAAEEKPPERRP